MPILGKTTFPSFFLLHFEKVSTKTQNGFWFYAERWNFPSQGKKLTSPFCFAFLESKFCKSLCKSVSLGTTSKKDKMDFQLSCVKVSNLQKLLFVFVQFLVQDYLKPRN